jgi:shikimate dehydrogenase
MAEVVPIGASALPLPAELLHRGQVVADLVYHPIVTPLVAAAREAGAVAVNGLGMLLHQAGRNFRLWTGQDPPLAAMSAAVLRELVISEPKTD